jgi:hypothetical protein
VARRLINTPKVTITLFWNPAGLRVNDFLAGESLNDNYFVRNVLIPTHLLPIIAAAHKQKGIYSADGQLADTSIKSCAGETVPDIRASGAASSLFT